MEGRKKVGKKWRLAWEKRRVTYNQNTLTLHRKTE